MDVKFESKERFVIVLSILLLTDIAILLNIPFLRQILGFLFITFLPGLLILQILKLNKIGSTEKIVLSVGLSISFVMFFGLIMNNSLLAIGYETPLATISLLISFNIALIALAIVSYKVNKEPICPLPNLNLTTAEKAFLIIPILFPALSLLGTHIMNTADNNLILMLLYLLIPAYVISICFFNQKFPKRLYPVVIFLISLSLLLVFMLRFPHIQGRDVHTEYYLFRTTLNNLHWGIVIHGTLDACLSISLLPTIYQSLMNENAQEYLFKGVCVSICSFTPLAVYVLSKRYVGESYAFLASFFFISQSVFLVAARHPRTSIAIAFAALAVLVFFNDKIGILKRRILFIIFVISVVVSHYATAYLFFFMILFTWIVVEIFSKGYTVNKKITLTGLLIFFSFIFFWYSQITVVPFDAGVTYFEETILNLNKFFFEEIRDPGLGLLVGQGLEYGIASKINFFAAWASFILIGIGVLTLFTRRAEMVSIPNVKAKKPDFLKAKFEIEFLVMALICAGILILTVALPYVSKHYGIDRLYSLVVIILSVCFVIGSITLSNLSLKQTSKKSLIKNAPQKTFKKRKDVENVAQKRAYSIILLILIPYFFMVTGMTHQIAGFPTSIVLNSEGEKYEIEYLHDHESCSAKWLKNCTEKEVIYTTGRFGRLKLISQMETRSIDSGPFARQERINGYLYLTYNNVVNDKFAGEGGYSSRTKYAEVFVGKNEVYDNGGSEVWK